MLAMFGTEFEPERHSAAAFPFISTNQDFLSSLDSRLHILLDSSKYNASTHLIISLFTNAV
jgi:hypothetical protein